MKKPIILILIIVLVVSVFNITGLNKYLNLQVFLSNKNMIETYVADNYLASVLIYILSYIVILAFSLPGAAFMTIVGGFLFGTIVGAVYVNISASLGGLAGFFMTRYFLGNLVQEKYGDNLKRINDEIEENGSNYFFTLRLIPIFPFFLVNIAAGLTKVTVKKFLITTSLGTIPGTLSYTFAGSTLRTVESLESVVSLRMLGVIIVLSLLSLLPIVYKKIKK